MVAEHHGQTLVVVGVSGLQVCVLDGLVQDVLVEGSGEMHIQRDAIANGFT